MPIIPEKFEVSADMTTIYEGGELSKITIQELINNETAIKQLMNQHNITAVNLKILQNELDGVASKNKFLNTSPYNAISTTIFNLIGSILIAFGVNNINVAIGPYLTGIGFFIVVISSISNILYPHIYRWFNKK